MATIDSFAPDTDNLQQQTVLQLIKDTSQSLFLTGKAGTGKSTLLRYIHEHTHKRHVILASTGIAALNVGGQTIHSFFRLPMRPLPPDDPDFSTERNRVYEVFRYTKEHKTLIRNLELIIIDEISMVRADVIDAIDRLLRVYRGHSHLPFGGVQMLFVGDLLQLEPVVKGDEKSILDRYYRSHFFFGARVFESEPIVGIQLEKVYRQADPHFIDILDRIRSGLANHSDVSTLNTRVRAVDENRAEELVITLAAKRSRVSYINERELERLSSPLHTLVGVCEGDFPEGSLPTERNLVLKEGAQVMFLSNDRDRRWANGTIGTVEQILVDEEGTRVLVRVESGEVHAVGQYVWENTRYTFDEEKGRVSEEVLGRFVQFPLRLAWAITIHKSQGLTFDHVVVDFTDRVFAGGQAYVALSRCRSLEGMTLTTPLSLRDIIARHEVIRFYSGMNNPAIITSALGRAEALRGYVEAARCWTRGRYAQAIEALGAAIEQSNELSNPLYLRLMLHKLHRTEQLQRELDEARRELEDNRQRLSLLAREHVAMGDECLQLANDAEAALRCYAKALELDPTSINALVGQGRAYQHLHRRSEATAALGRALVLSPLDRSALVAMGQLHLAYRMYEEALTPLLTALARDNDDIEVIRLIVEVYEGMNDDERAEQFRLLAKSKRKRRKQ